MKKILSIVWGGGGGHGPLWPPLDPPLVVGGVGVCVVGGVGVCVVGGVGVCVVGGLGVCVVGGLGVCVVGGMGVCVVGGVGVISSFVWLVGWILSLYSRRRWDGCNYDGIGRM